MKKTINNKCFISLVIIVIIFLGLFFIFFNKENNNPTLPVKNIDTTNWDIFENDELGIRIKYPEEMWVKNGDKFEVDVIGCYFVLNEKGEKFCDNKGNFYFSLDKNFIPQSSLDGFVYAYSKEKEERQKIDPNYIVSIYSLNMIEINGMEGKLYQVSSFGGDSTAFKIYIPTDKGLLTFNYNVAPAANDPEYVYHEQVNQAVLASLEVY